MPNIRYLCRIFALSSSFALLGAAMALLTMMLNLWLYGENTQAGLAVKIFCVALFPAFMTVRFGSSNSYVFMSITGFAFLYGFVLTVGWVFIVRWLPPRVTAVLRFNVKALAVSMVYHLALVLFLLWHVEKWSNSNTSPFPDPLCGLLYYGVKYSGLGALYAVLHALAWGYGTLFCVRWLKRRRTRTAG